MMDSYIDLINSPLPQKIARKLGLPKPVHLRRYHRGQELTAGPILLIGDSAQSQLVAEQLLSWKVDVRRHIDPKERLGGIVVVLDEVSEPEDLRESVLALSGPLRQLVPSARVVVISRSPEGVSDPALGSVRQGITGLVRSLAHELRAGATANGILVRGHVDVSAPSVIASLHFLLSAKSAYVDGQFLTVESDAGELPADWERPCEGKVALVTGAARGIGATIARTLHRDGAKVILVDVPAAGEGLAGVANEVGGTAVQLDVTHPDAAQKLSEHIRAHYGRLDILVQNAGITRDKLLANMDASRWDSVIAVNISAQLQLNQGLIASGVLAENAHVVSLASTSGIAGNRGQTNYATSKAAVIGMVHAAAPAFAQHGGTINAVAPGFIETEMTARIPFLTREIARRLSSLQQGGLPVDVAETIAFLASPASGGINGEVIRVCGQNLIGA